MHLMKTKRNTYACMYVYIGLAPFVTFLIILLKVAPKNKRFSLLFFVCLFVPLSCVCVCVFFMSCFNCKIKKGGKNCIRISLFMLEGGGDSMSYERELDGSHAGGKVTASQAHTRECIHVVPAERTHAHLHARTHNAAQHLIGLQGCNIYTLISDSK